LFLSASPQAGQATAFLGNSLVAADAADRSRSQVNVNVNSAIIAEFKAVDSIFNKCSFAGARCEQG